MFSQNCFLKSVNNSYFWIEEYPSSTSSIDSYLSEASHFLISLERVGHDNFDN